MSAITIDTQERFPLEEQTGVASSGQSFSFRGSRTYYIYSEPFNDFLGATRSFSILSQIPHVDVKAYYQTTVIQNLLNLLTSFADGVKKGMSEVANADEGTLTALGHKVKDIIAGMCKETSWAGVFKQLTAGIGYGSNLAVEKLPSALMLQLMSTIPINTYILPFFSQEIMKSSGSFGWGQASNTMVQGGTTGNAFHLLKTMGAFTTPVFNPNSGGGQPQTLTIEVDLFNDTESKARANTEFVKTLVVRNMWLQYGIFQTPGALYDIKIGSGNNYFNAMYMCTGEFTISKKGVMRSLDDFFVPDVYNVKATFSSLLPSNVNSYLFGRINIPQRRTSVLDDFLNNAKGVFEKFGAAGKADREAKEAVEKANTNLSEQATKLDETTKQLENIQKEKADQEKKVEELNKQLNNDQNNESIKNQIANLNKQIENNNSRLSKLGEQQATQKTAVSNARRQVAVANNRYAALNSSLSTPTTATPSKQANESSGPQPQSQPQNNSNSVIITR